MDTHTDTHIYTDGFFPSHKYTHIYRCTHTHTHTQNNYPTAGPGYDLEIQNSLICVKYFYLFVYGTSSANSDTELMLAEDDCIYKGK